jgi:hypothetical protein
LKNIIIIYLSLLALTGCTEAIIDVSNTEKFKQSLLVIRKDIPEESLGIFDNIIKEVTENARFNLSKDNEDIYQALFRSKLSEIHGLNSTDLFLKWKKKQDESIRGYEKTLAKIERNLNIAKATLDLVKVDNVYVAFEEISIDKCKDKKMVVCDEISISFTLTNNLEDIIYNPEITIVWGGNNKFSKAYFSEETAPNGVMPNETQKVELTIVNTYENIDVEGLIQANKFIVESIELGSVGLVKPHLKSKLAQLSEIRNKYLLAKAEIEELAGKSNTGKDYQLLGKDDQLTGKEMQLLFLNSDWQDEREKIEGAIVNKKVSVIIYRVEKTNIEYYIENIKKRISMLPSSIVGTNKV